MMLDCAPRKWFGERYALLPEKSETLNRFTSTALPPLVDAGLFCALIGNGLSLRSSHIASYAVAMALNYLLKVRTTIVAPGRTWDSNSHFRLLAASCMALFLRGGVLGMLSLHWGWPAQVSIVFAVLVAWAATTLGYSLAISGSDSGARTRALAIGLIAYAFALRLVYMGSVDLLPEEAYYWNYSRHLDFGYLDHPPMVAWLIRLGTAAFGQSYFGVRFGAVCCGVITSLFTYRLARNLFGETTALAALLLAQALPFFFLSGLLMTPDAPLAAAWAAALYYLERALLAGRSGAWWGMGIAVGLGAVSKYSIGLLLPVTVALMMLDRESRCWWRRWEPYGAALLALAIFSPVILWNAQHHWASFLFQTSRRLAEASRFALHKLIASSVVLITPTGVLAVVAAFTGAGYADSGDTGNAQRRRLFIRISVLLPLAVFAIFSLRHEVKLDWTGAPWTAALPLMAVGMIATTTHLNGLRAWLRTAWMPTLVTMLLFYGAGLHYLVLGIPGAGYSKHIELAPVAWREFSAQIAEKAATIRRETGVDPLIVGMDRYAIASELAFYGAERTNSVVETSSAHLFGGIGLMYALWTPAAAQEGRTLLLVAWGPGELSGKTIESHAERWGPVESGVLTMDGRVVRRYYDRLAYNYRAIPRP
ncbi:MAG TPA: glycosyltransferase family 39 protein [Steroidobacteraceae bacterium]|jgi:dolichol-phosphate mannosyltransferase|nr:glycosyltransferase family 39 protein [Steroidobacteraceae bacterium]